MIYFLFLNSLIIFGVHVLFDDGMLLGKLGDAIRKLNPYIQKPLTECPPCMASVWGTVFYMSTGMEIQYIVFYLLALAGLNYFLNEILKLIIRTNEDN